jgi:hypothetical protein
VERDLISVSKAASEFNLSTAVIFKYLREGRIKRWRQTGDRRTFVERAELKKLVAPRVVK